jgi:hypothetical protein
LPRIEKKAFNETGLTEIIRPSLVEVLGFVCFSECKSLRSVTVMHQIAGRYEIAGKYEIVGPPKKSDTRKIWP